jgi:hypothetical protein
VLLARARGGASQEGLVSLLGAERMRSHFVVAVANGAAVEGRNETVTKDAYRARSNFASLEGGLFLWNEA